MTALHRMLLSVSLVTALTACQRGDGGGGAAITRDDTPDIADLIEPDGDEVALAAQVGDPATLRLAGLDQAERVRADIASILGFLSDATAREPDAQGEDLQGRPLGRWTVSDGETGNTVHVIAVRTAEDRVRIIVQGENGEGLTLPLLTGVFVKKGPRVGGGRFHLSLSNYSDLFAAEGQGADGSIHFLFANNRVDLRGRRVLYLNVDERATAEADPKSFAADLVRLPGVGGRYRSIYATDMIPQLEGLEAIGMRAVWLAAVGGRADVVVATQANGGQVLGVARECWDQAGLRTAYADTMLDNDDVDPNEGNVEDCYGIVNEPAADDKVQGGGEDTDEELDAALEESGATDVDEDEAADESVPEEAPEA